MLRRLLGLLLAFSVAVLPATGASAQTLGIATTKDGGVAQITAGIAKVVSSKTDRQMRTQPRAGTQLYIPEVNAGQIEFGAANINQLIEAVTGKGLFEGHANANLRMVGSLMPFLVGLMVKDDSNINKLADLKGKRVPSGLKSSPSGLITLKACLANAGLTLDDVEQVPTTSFVTMWNWFEAGKLDTTVTVVGSGRNQQFAAKMGKVRFLNLDPSPKAYARSAAFLPASEPTLVKPSPGLTGIEEPTYVIGYSYTLFAHKDVADDIVYRVVKAIYENQNDFRETSAIWRSFEADKLGKKYADVEYHPGAVKLFREKGIW